MIRETILVWIISGLIVMVLGLIGVFNPTQYAAYDLFTNAGLIRGRSPAIRVVEIDEAAISQFGKWPWKRKMMARLLESIAKSSPAVIGVDVFFAEPSDSDRELADVINRIKPTVVLPVFISHAPFNPILSPVNDLITDRVKLGHVNLNIGDDGIVRSIYLMLGCCGVKYLAFPLMLFIEYNKVVYGSRRVKIPTTIYEGEDRNFLYLIPYSREFYENMPVVSAADVLQGKVDEREFKDKVVLIGVSAAGLGDRYIVPLTRNNKLSPGVEIHAMVLNSFLNGSFLKYRDLGDVFLFSLVILLLGFFMVYVFKKFSSGFVVLTLLMGIFAIFLLSWAYFRGGIYVDPVPFISWLALFSGTYFVGDLLSSEKKLLETMKLFESSASLMKVPERIDEFIEKIYEHFKSEIKVLQVEIEGLGVREKFVQGFLESGDEGQKISYTFEDRVGNETLKVNVGMVTKYKSFNHELLAKAIFKPVELYLIKRKLDELSAKKRSSLEYRLMQLRYFVELSKMNSEFLVSMVNVGEVGIVVFDYGDNVVFSNKIGLQFWNDIKVFYKNFRYLFNRNGFYCGQESSYPFKFVVESISGRVYSVVAAPVEAYGYWLLSIIDITAIKEKEKIKEEIVYMLTHDLRSPLTVLKGLLEILGSGDSDFDREIMKRVMVQIDYMGRLVENFLLIYQIEGKEDIEKEEVEVSSLFAQAIEVLKDEVELKKARILLENDDCVINVNAALMREVFINLLDNAIKYGGDPPMVRVKAVNSNGGCLITVEDNGSGIPEKYRDKVFERFFRLASSKKGSGLGLAIVKLVVTLHGGKVWVEKGEMGGSRFCILL